jgi:hypothetical protein
VPVDLVGRPDLHHPAEVHDHHLVRHVVDHAEVVGDQQDREAELVAQVLEQVEDLGLDRDVERRDRLVGDDQLGLDGERTRNPDPLPLAARELVGVAPPVLGQEAPRRNRSATRSRRSAPK